MAKEIILDETHFDAKIETEIGTYYVRNTYDIDDTHGGITGLSIYDDDGKYITNVSGLSVYVEDGEETNRENVKEIANWIEDNLEF